MADVEQPTVFDTGQQQLGAVYAKALLGAAEAAGTTDEVVEQIDSFVNDVLLNVKGLYGVLASPRIAVEEKEKVLDQAFGDKMDGTLLRFLKVTARHGRLDCIRAIAEQVRSQFNELRGIVEIVVQTATELESATLETIKQRLESSLGKTVQVKTEIDPSIIGGLVVRDGDTVYDGSLANRIARMETDAVSKIVQTLREQSDRFTSGT